MKKSLLIASIGLTGLGCFGNACVARGSRVFTPEGWRPIEDLVIGDLVFAVREATGEQVATPVTAIKSAMREVGMVQIDGATLRMTSDHPVYCPVDKIYAPAGDWFLGTRTALAMLTDGALVAREVNEVQAYVDISEVFDITVEHELHNFITEGFLVHNKDPVVNCAVDQCYSFDAGNEPTDANGQSDANSTEDVGGSTDAETSDAADLGADTGTDAGADSGTDLGVDAGMLRERGTCVTDVDCANPDSTCISVPANDPAAYFTCQGPMVDAPNCGTIMAPDECCQHSDCTEADPNSVCVQGPIFYCGGAAPQEMNICITDECVTESDCEADQVCVPAGAFREPASRCVNTECELDADCTAGTGGQCNPFINPCNSRFEGFFCSYDDSECRTNEDCTVGFAPYCAPGVENGDTSCQEFFPPP